MAEIVVGHLVAEIVVGHLVAEIVVYLTTTLLG